MTPLALEGHLTSNITGMSADGSILVGQITDTTGISPVMTHFESFRLSGNNYTTLQVIDSSTFIGFADFGSHATAVSADGNVIVGVDQGMPYRWVNGVGLTTLTSAGDTTPAAVSADGSVAAGWDQAGNTYRPVYWTGQTLHFILQKPPFDPSVPPYGQALGVSAAGSTIVGAVYNIDSVSGGPLGAFIWNQANGRQNLQQVLVNAYGLGTALAGWTLTEATAITPDVQTIVGDGTGPNGPGAWIVHLGNYTPPPPVLPKFEFDEVTTLDAQSVATTYTILNADITQPLTFDVYRSDQPFKDSTSVPIGEQTIDPKTNSQDLTHGNHIDVPLIKGTSLPPNPFMPYVVVVADANGAVQEDPGSINTAYFQKYLLGVVSHGFLLQTSNDTPAWETQMQASLMNEGYNNVIAFNWASMSLTPKAGEAVAAGNMLFSQIVANADQLAAGHAGDVVDLHLIGHSRGAVVVTQALQDLVGTTDPRLAGGYFKLTLLDPHPAHQLCNEVVL